MYPAIVSAAMYGIDLDDSRLDGIGHDTAQQTNGARCSSGTAADDRLAAQLSGLPRNPRFARHHILKQTVEVGFGEILDAAVSDQRQDMAVHPA